MVDKSPEVSKYHKYLAVSQTGKCSKFTGLTKYLPVRLFDKIFSCKIVFCRVKLSDTLLVMIIVVRAPEVRAQIITFK